MCVYPNYTLRPYRHVPTNYPGASPNDQTPFRVWHLPGATRPPSLVAVQLAHRLKSSPKFRPRASCCVTRNTLSARALAAPTPAIADPTYQPPSLLAINSTRTASAARAGRSGVRLAPRVAQWPTGSLFLSPGQ